MRNLAVLIVTLSAFFAHLAQAKPVPFKPGQDSREVPLATASLAVPAAKSAVDTTYLLGGPGSWDGSFETPGGQPDWHGWTHEDISLNIDNHWHVSTYMADRIAGKGPGNHALYCGDEAIPPCAAPDTSGGYGDNWFEDIEWRQAVADPSQPVTVRLTGNMNFDTEEGYDYVYLLIQHGDTPQILDSWEGYGSIALDITTVVPPASFTGPGNDEVRLVWRFDSDASWSDMDCRFSSRGACQIDDLAVYLDDLPVTFDDFEPGNPVNWTPFTFPGVGDFASLRNNLNSVHSCQSENSSYQVNFVDDGVVVPGTGGTPCLDWCYGPGGYILNHDGGLMADIPVDFHLINQVVSAPIPWPGNMDGGHLSFDIFIHEPFRHGSSGMFGFWKVRSTASSDPADLQFAPWVNRNTFIENSSGSYRRMEEPVGDLLVPDRRWVQIALGVNEFGFIYGIDGPNGTPSPYYDNVSFKVWDPVGPDIQVPNSQLFGDAFPEAGLLDPVNLAANSCRVDMTGTNYQADRGDTLVARITPLRQGAAVVDSPALHWVMKCNPVFDAVRPAPPDAGGLLRGMVPGSVAVSLGQLRPGNWAFDLPDTGFFFPGDLLHYYVIAADDLDGDVRPSVWPPDTTGVLDFSLTTPYPHLAGIRGLPATTQPTAGQFAHPAVLLVDDSNANPQSRALWLEALEDLGFTPGTDLDVLTIFSPEDLSLFLNANLLGNYHTLLYSAGTIYPSLDFGGPAVVLDWLDSEGKKGLFAGQALVARLDFPNSGDGQDLKFRLGAYYQTFNVVDRLGGNGDLQVNPTPGNGVLPEDLTWQINAVCPDVRWLNAIQTQGSGQSAASLDAVGIPGGSYSAVVTVDDPVLGNRTAVLPFDLDAVSGMSMVSADNGSTSSPSNFLVYFLMSWLGADPVSAVDDVPGIGQVAAAAHPNPFNPQTTIAFDLPRAMEVSLDIFDLQGRLVRRLLNGNSHIAGRHKQVWDGRNGEGQAASSGIYFFRLQAGDQNRVGKLTLLK